MRDSELERNDPAKRYLLVIAAVTFLAGSVLRFLELGKESLWYDEIVSVSLASEPWKELLGGTAREGGNPQGFWIMLKLWMQLGVESDGALRVLPAIFGIAGLIAFAFLAIETSRPKVAVLAFVLLAFNPSHIAQSQELRSSSLLFFASVAVCFFALRWSKTGSWWSLAGYVVCAIVGLYGHYYVGLALVAVNLWMIPRLGTKPRFAGWMLCQILVLLVYLPQFALFRDQLSVRATSVGDASASFLHIAATPLTLLFGRTLAWKSEPIFFGALLATSLVLWSVAAFVVARRGIRQEERLMVAGVIVPLAMVLALMLTKDLQAWDDRKALVCLGPTLILLASAIGSFRERTTLILVVPIVLIQIAAVSTYFAKTQKDQWSDLAHWMSTQVQAQDLIIVSPEHETISIKHYLLKNGLSVDALPNIGGYSEGAEKLLLVRRADVTFARYAQAMHSDSIKIKERLRYSKEIWLIENPAGSIKNESKIQKSVISAGAKLAETRTYSKNLIVQRYSVQ